MVKAHQDQVISYQAQAKAHQAQVLIHQAQVDSADTDVANAKKKADAEATIKNDNQLVTTQVSLGKAEAKANETALVITKEEAATKAQTDNSAAVILSTVNKSILSIISVSAKNRWGSIYGESGKNIFIRLLNGAIWVANISRSFSIDAITTTDNSMFYLYTPGMGNNGWQGNNYFTSISSTYCSVTSPILPNGPLNRCIGKDISSYGIKDIQINPNRKAGNNILKYLYGNQVIDISDPSGLLTIPPTIPTKGPNSKWIVIEIK
jgi:hypothetical protein